MKEVLDYLPNVLKVSDVIGYSFDPEITRGITYLMTPDEILHQRDFPKPEVIDPFKYSNFDSLIGRRDDIRYLRLLPVKSGEEYTRYHDVSKELLEGFILDYLKDSKLTMAINRFPYWLPEDLGQYIIWASNPYTPNLEIAEFIARIMPLVGLSLYEIILFERPKNITQKLIRGTFPDIRHIHLWIKIK